MTDSREAGINSVIRDQIETRLKHLHTTTPGIIDTFDTVTQRATIQPSIQRVLAGGEFISLPNLINVPLGNLRAGGFALTLPVKSGDECIIFFTERSLDNWIRTGAIREPNDIRLHSESDAFFIPSVTSEPNIIQNYDPDNIVLRNDANTQKITLLASGEVVIDCPTDTTINTVGNATINANTAEINTEGDTSVNAGGNCNINGSQINNNGSAAGVVTTLSINPVTGTPFPDGSATLRNSDG